MDALERILNHKFHKIDLLIRALTHPNGKNQQVSSNYERLEFLGDTVLSLVITEMLMVCYPEDDEGVLARKRSYLVQGTALTKIARDLNLSKHIKLEEKSKSLTSFNDSILENVLEAVIGAIYLDDGLEAAKRFIHAQWLSLVKELKTPPIEPKTFVQEWAQERGLPLPEYITQPSSEYRDEQPLFLSVLKIKDQSQVSGVGKNKKQAEKNAAKAFIKNNITNDK